MFCGRLLTSTFKDGPFYNLQFKLLIKHIYHYIMNPHSTRESQTGQPRFFWRNMKISAFDSEIVSLWVKETILDKDRLHTFYYPVQYLFWFCVQDFGQTHITLTWKRKIAKDYMSPSFFLSLQNKLRYL